VSQHIIWVLFGDTKLLIFSRFTKLICCYFIINQQVILLAKVELLIKRPSIKSAIKELELDQNEISKIENPDFVI